MDMDSIYIVYFHTGEFEDSWHEISKLFYSYPDAKKYSDTMNDSLKELGLHVTTHPCIMGGYELRHSKEVVEKFGASIDYTGADFYVVGPLKIEK